MQLNKIYNENCLKTLWRLEDNFIDCVVTSPPYWGLRDYGHDEQIGLEKTPEEYVARMVEIFREVRRVLKKEGTLWLNLGDSYAGNWGAMSHDLNGKAKRTGNNGKPVTANFSKSKRIKRGSGRYGGGNNFVQNLKAKDLVGIPWRVAFALQADGWWLRQDIIWSKPNPMPESVKDRCTKSHEYIFLLTKSGKYFYDAEAISENISDATLERAKYPWNGIVDDNSNGSRSGSTFKKMANGETNFCLIGTNGKRNKRSVWEITTQPFPEAHFAVFPEKIPSLCILAGCPEGGIVYDPFMGAATTALAALKYNRQFIGSEINAEYCEMGEKRIKPYLDQYTLAI